MTFSICPNSYTSFLDLVFLFLERTEIIYVLLRAISKDVQKHYELFVSQKEG